MRVSFAVRSNGLFTCREAWTSRSSAAAHRADSLAECLREWQSCYCNYNHSGHSNNKAGHKSPAPSAPGAVLGILHKSSHFNPLNARHHLSPTQILGSLTIAMLPIAGTCDSRQRSAWGLRGPLCPQCRDWVSGVYCTPSPSVSEWPVQKHETPTHVWELGPKCPGGSACETILLGLCRPCLLPHLPWWEHVLNKSPAHKSSSQSMDLLATLFPFYRRKLEV